MSDDIKRLKEAVMTLGSLPFHIDVTNPYGPHPLSYVSLEELGIVDLFEGEMGAINTIIARDREKVRNGCKIGPTLDELAIVRRKVSSLGDQTRAIQTNATDMMREIALLESRVSAIAAARETGGQGS